MSLFESASLCVTPNGTKASKLYAVKPVDGSGDLSVTRATTATRVNSAGLIESVAVNVPRLDYTNSTCPSILVEPQRTNIFKNSEDFSNASWIKTDANVTANFSISPDGTTTADRVVFLNSGSAIEQLVVYSAGNLTHTISCYIKTNSGTKTFQLKLTHAGVANYYSPTYTATTQWQKFTFTQAFGSGGTGFYAGVISDNTTLDIWGLQLEANSSYATSYIPTTTASVTRNADVINKTGISSLIGQTEGTMFIDINYKSDSVFKNLFNLGTSTSNYIAIVARSNNKIGAEVLNAGVQVNNEGATIYTSQRLKIAFAYKANDFVMYVNGVLTFSQNSGTVPAKAEVYLGSYGNGTQQPKDGINSAALWKTRLSNTELATLTTI